MRDKILDIQDYIVEHTPHCTAELICVRCLHRWIGVWPEECLLKDLSCPHCKNKGAVITTGQILEEDYGDT